MEKKAFLTYALSVLLCGSIQTAEKIKPTAKKRKSQEQSVVFNDSLVPVQAAFNAPAWIPRHNERKMSVPQKPKLEPREPVLEPSPLKLPPTTRCEGCPLCALRKKNSGIVPSEHLSYRQFLNSSKMLKFIPRVQR